ncbi:hypothetical protein MSG28_008407 [Choristoneura fumiferana]|uniref:Uncharacterized protein n=1 Tax=Choristoneura fumiferana TaxID=7141 RepID=A0ACC0J5J2_CHOFU|nr:hypothetical protein MSG28_008407 [Choristoneura fumiferana]
MSKATKAYVNVTQYVQVIDISGNVACSVVTGEASLGNRLVSSLEWSARTSPLKVQRPPAIIPLSCRQLAATVARQRHQDKLDEILYYGRACSGDAGDRLMEARGLCAAFGGLPHVPHRPQPPLRALLLSATSVVGVRRHVDVSRRPHCFEIALGTGGRLLLAAPDDPAASSWLQSLLLHAAQWVATAPAPGDLAVSSWQSLLLHAAQRAGAPAACTVLVTPREVISVRDTLDLTFVAGAAAYLRDRGSDALLKDVEILACGSIKN